jgi:hypothetical protein
MCTKDDMTELQRATFLLKKGYEIQKISVSYLTSRSRFYKQYSYEVEVTSCFFR